MQIEILLVLEIGYWTVWMILKKIFRNDSNRCASCTKRRRRLGRSGRSGQDLLFHIQLLPLEILEVSFAHKKPILPCPQLGSPIYIPVNIVGEKEPETILHLSMFPAIPVIPFVITARPDINQWKKTDMSIRCVVHAAGKISSCEDIAPTAFLIVSVLIAVIRNTSKKRRCKPCVRK